MSETAERYRRNAADFTAKVASVPPDRWSNPSPCEGWTARDVVAHVVQSETMFFGFIGQEVGPIPDVEGDPLAAWQAVRDQMQAALEDEEVANAEFDGFSGRTTFADAVDRFASTDLPIHGWDLARAAGLDDTIDPAEVKRGLREFPKFGEMMRGSNAFGPAVEPPPDADEQTRLLNFLGRQV